LDEVRLDKLLDKRDWLSGAVSEHHALKQTIVPPIATKE
jgi:hypothetical protein